MYNLRLIRIVTTNLIYNEYILVKTNKMFNMVKKNFPEELKLVLLKEKPFNDICWRMVKEPLFRTVVVDKRVTIMGLCNVEGNWAKLQTLHGQMGICSQESRWGNKTSMVRRILDKPT